ncbi:MAG TPA: 4Fe-4S dicluster domain-containing protein [Cyclobacteriaceae bacterium]|nr:4Fe-4S dicluster domain-containing protein [Cyclobacteriaceae bacterium]
MVAKSSYWSGLRNAVSTLLLGLKLTGRHIVRARHSKKSVDITDAGYFKKQTGITTIQFPNETIPVPDNGRYQLYNEIDDCIVCDKCAKICPVNCITIEPIRSPEEFGKTSDGTSKRIYAAKFDIDMGKCCFCGLCTTVCPTECLTMTKTYDFSVWDIKDHNFVFGEMSEQEIAQRKKEWEVHQQTKAALPPIQKKEGGPAKPVFKPKIPPTPQA